MVRRSPMTLAGDRGAARWKLREAYQAPHSAQAQHAKTVGVWRGTRDCDSDKATRHHSKALLN